MGITHLSGLQVAGVPTMGMSGIPATTGNVWFVNSVSGSNGNTGAANSPLATIAQAVTLSTADNGDIIVLTAGHAETISAAGGITINKSGLTIWCLGEGADRPTITFATSTAATFLITSGNFQIGGAPMVCVCNIASLVTGFAVQAADVTLNIEWHDTSSTIAALRAVLTTAAANRFNCNLVYLGFSANVVNVNAIRLVGGRDANIILDYYGAVTTAVVEFVTTATINTQISGYFYSSGTTNFSKTVVDTVTGSTWAVVGFDGAAGLSFDGGSGKAIAGNDVSTVLADLAVPSIDSTANVLERDALGNKGDTGVTVVGTTNSVAAYAKGLVTMLTAQAANSTANAFSGDITGNKTDTAVYVPGTTKSLAAYMKGVADLQERVAFRAATVLTNGMTLFTVTGGPIEIIALVGVCVVGGDATAATLQYSVTPTSGSAQTISGASASLAASAAGASVSLAGTALATAALLNANGPNLMANPGTIFCPAGTITAVIGSGPTVTGTWAFYLRYKPLATGITSP